METEGEQLLQARAEDIHRRHPVILIHDHDPLADDQQECRAAGISGKVFVPVIDAFVDENPMASAPIFDGWADHARGVFMQTLESIQATCGRVLLATSAADFRRAHREGKLVVLLGSEGGKLVEGSLDRLPEFYEMGYRCMQMRWNCPNQIVTKEADGLTAFGRELIPALNRLGIMIDAMHAGRRAFFEMAALSKHPLLLSHGGAQGALRKARIPGWGRGNDRTFVDDEMLSALAETGGLLGINLYGPQFAPTDSQGQSDVTLEDVAEHFQYVADAVGVDTLAIGGDYFPTYGHWLNFGPSSGVFREQFVVPKSGLTRLTAHLLALGWREEDITKVLGGNFLRFCERILGPGKDTFITPKPTR